MDVPKANTVKALSVSTIPVNTSNVPADKHAPMVTATIPISCPPTTIQMRQTPTVQAQQVGQAQLPQVRLPQAQTRRVQLPQAQPRQVQRPTVRAQRAQLVLSVAPTQQAQTERLQTERMQMVAIVRPMVLVYVLLLTLSRPSPSPSSSSSS